MLSACFHHDAFISILAAVILLPSSTPRYIELLLGSRAVRAWYQLDWLLVHGPEEGLTAVSHASFTAFLLDQSRSGRFFVDIDYHADYFMHRWLRAHRDANKSEGTLALNQWYDFCSALGTPMETISSELHEFYEETWSAFSSHGDLSSVIPSIALLSRHTKVSLEIIDLLHETPKHPELYYYLHMGDPVEDPGIEPMDGSSHDLPRFFEFLSERISSEECPIPPHHRDFLARRTVECLVRLCHDPTK
ncbi:hypothetical protein V5O48_012084, partial [Marasmius crinis-equi]